MEGFFEVFDIGDDAGFAGFAGEFDGGFDFGKHRAGFEIAEFDEVAQLFGCGFMDGILAGQAVVDINIRNGSDGDEDICFGEFGELFGGIIFVDDGIDAF